MNKTVLIADDDPDIVDLLTWRCGRLGLAVHSASNAMDALRKAQEVVPDIVVLDVDMPYGNGMSVCEMMSGHDSLSEIPVIMLTGNKSEETVRRCHQLCAYYVLKCPDVWQRIEPILLELLSPDDPALESETLEGEMLERAAPKVAAMESATLESAALESAALESATLESATLESATLESATLESAAMEGASTWAAPRAAAPENRREPGLQASEPPVASERPVALKHGVASGPRSRDSAASAPVDRQAELMDAVFAVLGVEDGELFDDDPNAPAPRSDQPWVLSIEDDDDVALALKIRLREFGVEVIRATAGMEGYRKAFLVSPRAIILDYELPGGNGDYVLKRLKESQATSSIPVIVLTGRQEVEIERRMRKLGASEFLTKPFDWRRLRAALNLHLDADLGVAVF